ncbi:ASF1 like histone chaperone-domain-containing protein [Russula ochroleuca]|uniref:Anti-silencing function protein 1 n=1 Tax=Russula ochroleuca TaxID=152965 RepID=A0A9P5TF85_9AGAM|nr:ASF1 like histone chaperone-domain-containing protein [Russula ochroleuca]
MALSLSLLDLCTPFQNVEFLNNPARFLDPYHFRVTFECIAALKEDLEWRLIYVASPGNAELDQELDDCLVGPVPVGVNAFEFEGSAPSPQSIPPEDVLGVAALILTGSYCDQEFVRVGYYQNTEYDNDEMKLAPPEKIQFDKLVRDISAKPRVTRFQIKWYVIVIIGIACWTDTPWQGRLITVRSSSSSRGGKVSSCSLSKRPRR